MGGWVRRSYLCDGPCQGFGASLRGTSRAARGRRRLQPGPFLQLYIRVDMLMDGWMDELIEWVDG